jgi:hypothetical protein
MRHYHSSAAATNRPRDYAFHRKALAAAPAQAYSENIITPNGSAMKAANFSTLMDDTRDACLLLWQGLKRVVREIAAMPSPALLACAFMLALALTLIPLALTLFIAFLLIKLIVGAIVIDKQKSRRS